MKRAVLLGGGGFIGRYLGKELWGRGYKVVVADLENPHFEWANWMRADARDLQSVVRVIEPKDLVVHLVHSSIPVESMGDPVAEIKENVVPYAALLDVLADLSVSAVVYSSSGGQIYGNVEPSPIPENTAERPVSAYGVAKLAMEQLTRLITRRRGLPHLIFRIGNPYGPFQEKTNRHGVVPALVRTATQGGPFVSYGGGVTVRDYIYAADAARAVVDVITGTARSLTVNVGTGRGTSLSDLMAMVENVTGGKIEVKEEPLRPSDVRSNVLDITCLKTLTGFVPSVTLEEGLQLTWKHLKENEKK